MMKTLTVLFVLAVSASAFAQDAQIPHDQMVELVSESAGESLCTDTQDFINCVGITANACTDEVAQLVKGKCATYIPAEGVGMDKAGSVGKDVTRCVTSALMAKYKGNIKKNAQTPACQSFLK